MPKLKLPKDQLNATIDKVCEETLKSMGEDPKNSTLKKLIRAGIKNNLSKTSAQYNMVAGQRTPFEKRLKPDLILLAKSRKIHVTQSMTKSQIISLLRK